jgi:hypothetical protein
MGSEGDIVQRQERVIGSERFVLEHVQRRSHDNPPSQRVDQRRLIHQSAAGRVAQHSRRFHPREFLGPDQPPALGCQARVQRHNVRLLQQGVQIDPPDRSRVALKIGS